MFAEFISQYGTQIIYGIVVGIFGFCGIVLKNIATKILNNKEKKCYLSL